ncbi:MAG: cytochrome c biogenesis protein ResB [Rikenellaceae bacterium]
MQEIKSNKLIWQAPWGYSESFAIIGGITLIGLMLQLTVGSFDFYLLSAPINFYVGTVLTILSILLGIKCKTSSFARWFASIQLAVATLSVLLLLTIIMGLTPQMTEQTTKLGFEMMTSNWAFVFLYTILIISVGVVIVRRIRLFKPKDIPFYLNHFGLWLLLISSGLGYADMQRYIMYVSEGETEWRVYDNENNIKELPIAITLNDFSMEFYPARKVVVDTQTGKILKGEVEDYTLDERYKAMSTAPEPRSFISDVVVYTESGDKESTLIEVNHPLRIGSWTIYQYGYDNAAGNESSYSSFELVYDSWIVPVYIGIILMMLGSMAMIWSGRKIGIKNDVE